MNPMLSPQSHGVDRDFLSRLFNQAHYPVPFDRGITISDLRRKGVQ
jgi:hypothetical protein